MPMLIENGSATGSAKQWDGGRGVFAAVATFGGGSVRLQLLGPDGSTWIDVATLTAAGVTAFELPPGRIRAAVTTATAVYASAEQSKG